MRYLKILGSAAATAMALAAFLGAGSASATVICENNQTSSCTAPWATNGTGTLDMSLAAGFSAKLRDPIFGTTLNTCTEATLHVIVERGTPNFTPGGEARATFGKCVSNVSEATPGEIEIHSIAGSDQGTVTAKGFALTFIDPFGNMCAYGAGTGLDLGNFIPDTVNGTDGTININVLVNLVAAHSDTGCVAQARWTAVYTQTSSTPIRAISAS